MGKKADALREELQEARIAIRTKDATIARLERELARAELRLDERAERYHRRRY